MMPLTRRNILILILVVVTSGSLLLWFFSFLTPYFQEDEWLDVEKQDTISDLGNAESKNLALAPLDVEKLARKLGYASSARALSDVLQLRDRINAGFLPKSWQTRCWENAHPSLCRTLEDYFSPRVQKSLQTKAPKPPSLKRKITRSMKAKDIEHLQQEDFGVLWRELPSRWDFRDYMRFAPLALNVTSCPRNFSLALARELETHLEDPATFALIERLDSHGLECVGAGERHAEFLFFHSALLHYFYSGQQKTTNVTTWLEKARQVENPKELYRTLYWSWKITGEEKFLNELVQKFPLAWHTIYAETSLGRDPLRRILKARAVADQMETSNAPINRAMYWFQLLLYAPDSEIAANKFVLYLTYLMSDPATPPGAHQYIARLMHATGLHRMQIAFLSQWAARRPQFISLETLKLLYPKPFLSHFRESAQRLDTPIIIGLARQESGFDPRARSHANAQGLLQLLPKTAQALRSKKYDPNFLYDYSENIELGSEHLIQEIARFDGSIERALAAYNAGPTPVFAWTRQYIRVSDTQGFLDLLPYKETRDYVPSILRNAYWYHRLYTGWNSVHAEEVISSIMLKQALRP